MTGWVVRRKTDGQYLYRTPNKRVWVDELDRATAWPERAHAINAGRVSLYPVGKDFTTKFAVIEVTITITVRVRCKT